MSYLLLISGLQLFLYVGSMLMMDCAKIKKIIALIQCLGLGRA